MIRFRPFIFFESASDLMSKYWSGALNQKATALQVKARLHYLTKQCDMVHMIDVMFNVCFQGTQPIQDSESFVALRSGAVIRSGALGILSYDFSGKAEFSIWDKTCKTTVEDSVAYSMRHSADLIMPLTDVTLGYVIKRR